MKARLRIASLGAVGAVVLIAVLVVWWRFDPNIETAGAADDGCSNGADKEKRAAAFMLQPVDFIGGVDGARTRDPRRDRPVF